MPNPRFAANIRPLFRDKDIKSMQLFADFDLSNVADVRSNSRHIYQRLEAKDMPCDGPWSDENIALFKSWMDAGMDE